MPFFDQPGQPRQHKPWPMKWVVLSIAIFIVGYTWIRVKYSKPGPSYEPYQDTVDRMTVERLLSSGYQRFDAPAEVPADSVRTLVLGSSSPAPVAVSRGGIPSEINVALIQKPALADAIDTVLAPRTGPIHGTYRILFVATLPDARHTAAAATVFRRGRDLTIIPGWERIEGRLQARSRSTAVLVSIPTGSLPAGDYRATVVGARSSRSWTVDLRQ